VDGGVKQGKRLWREGYLQLSEDTSRLGCQVGIFNANCQKFRLFKCALACENPVWYVRHTLACGTIWHFLTLLTCLLSPFELLFWDCFQPFWHLLMLFGMFFLTICCIWSI